MHFMALSDDAHAQVRPIDHETGSHGVPGIYFKYDMSALKVIVNQASKSIQPQKWPL